MPACRFFPKTDHLTALFRGLQLFAVGAVLQGAAYGTTLATNIGSPPNGDSFIDGINGAAEGFTITGSNWNLTDAIFTLFDGINGSPAPAIDVTTSPFAVGLYADSGGQPNGSALVILTLTTNTIAGGLGTYTATPGSPFELLAGTTYWLVLNDHDPSLLLTWRTTSSAPTTDGATYDGGVTGGMTSSTQVSNGTFVTAGTHMFQIDADPVTSGGAPEPGTLFLLGGGLLGLSRRRVRWIRAKS